MKNIYIVLVNYNGKKYIKECLDSIGRQTYKDIKIIVVDNASSDGSLQVLEAYKDLVLLRRHRNEGFARGCNIGIKYALKAGAEYVMLLNIDTKIDDDLVYKLYNAAGPNTVTAPQIFYDGSTTKIWYSGGDMDFQLGSHIQYHDKRLEHSIPPKPNHPIRFVTGCCMLVHRNIWKKVGLLDEKYFMYFDDDDLSLRFLKKKVKMLYVPSAKMWHKVGGCFKGTENSLTTYYFVRNRLYFTKKHADVMQTNAIKLSWKILQQSIFMEKKSFTGYKIYVIRGIVDFYLQRMYKAKYKFV